MENQRKSVPDTSRKNRSKTAKASSENPRIPGAEGGGPRKGSNRQGKSTGRKHGASTSRKLEGTQRPEPKRTSQSQKPRPVVELQINDISADGNGIGHAPDGLTVFVEGGLPGDRVKVELYKVKKRYALGRTLELLEASPNRLEEGCPLANNCGGCPLGQLGYGAQLELKEKHVRDALTRIAGLEDAPVCPILPAENLWRYRNKATMAVSTGGIITRKGGVVENLGEPAVGFYGRKTHDVVDCPDCGLQSEPAIVSAQVLREFMAQDNITGYDPRWEKGLLRQMVVRTAFGTGEVMVILVINGNGIPNGEKLVGMLDEAIAAIPWDEDTLEEIRREQEAQGIEEDEIPGPYSLESVILNINKEKSGVIFSNKKQVLAGRPTIQEEIGGMQFEISPLSFYQVNPEQMVTLYDKVTEYADLQGGETVLDLYCGAGTIGLWLLNDLRERNPEAFETVQVLGIESVKSAILDANRNAVINGIVNARYTLGKAEIELPKLVQNGIEDANLVILDPPRAGCDERLLEAVVQVLPQKIVYVSCDPATLARDVKYLGEHGYELLEATPVDLFCHTAHVETVAFLSRA